MAAIRSPRGRLTRCKKRWTVILDYSYIYSSKLLPFSIIFYIQKLAGPAITQT
jgi:hypothetical protein